MTPLKLKLVRTKQHPHDRVKRLLAKRPVGLKVLPPEPEPPAPPKTRGECEEGERPCPHATCRYHLDSAKESCALDVADRGPVSPKEIGEVLGITRQMVERIEGRAMFWAMLWELMHARLHGVRG